MLLLEDINGDLARRGLHASCPVAKDCRIFKEQKCAGKIFSYHALQYYIYRTLQYIVFITLSNLNKTSNRAATHTSNKMRENRCVLLRVICTCDSPFCALQLTALIKPNRCVLLYCCACLYHSLIVVQPSWTTVPWPTTKLSLLISKLFVGIKQSVINVALKYL